MGFFTSDIAIDLGTANTLIYVKGRGVVLNEPSIVAVSRKRNEVLAVGHEAKRMLGRTPDTIRAIRPLKDGVIADFQFAEKMLIDFIRMALRHRPIIKPRVVVCVPHGITNVERRAVRDSVLEAGARAVYMIEEPMAAAIGVNLPIEQPVGNMVIDIGGGTTEVAVISLCGIVCNTTIRVAGDEMTAALETYMRRAYNVLVGESSAEEIKKTIGNAVPLEKEEYMKISGRDLVAGIPKTIRFSSREVREALAEPIKAIDDAVHQTLERTPPELASDIIERGVIMTGGGALLRGLDAYIGKSTNLLVTKADDPLTCMVRGVAIVLSNLKYYRDILGPSLSS
jgi:rod shape-determining protein MreB